MTRLNLIDTSLLEASGELDPAARQRLMDYFERHPGAQAQFQTLKAEMELLRSLPRPRLTEEQKALYSGNIKQGIHRKLRAQEREEQSARRRRLIYTALAGISGIAAAIVIVVGVLMMHDAAMVKSQVARADRIRNAVDVLTPYEQEPNQVDDTLNDVAASIHQLQSESPTVAGIQDTDMSNLLDALATVPSNTDSDNAPPEPGSL
jgi:hypothetical protein